MFPHCLLIIAHLGLIVKRFFEKSLAIPDIFLGDQLLVSWLHHQGLAFVVGISPTLFQPVGSGSHLYSAHLHTMRSGHGVKGLTDSRGSFPLGLPCPRLLYPYCITTWEICQEFFLSFYPMDSKVWWVPLALLTSLTLYHTSGGLSRGFLHFFSRMVRATFTHRGRYPVATSPLDTNILSHLSADYKMEYCTIVGSIICAFLCDFLLDKLLAVCYNGNFAPSIRGRAAEKMPYSGLKSPPLL